MFNYESCVKKGLLRRIPNSKDKSQRSLDIAKKWLNEAQITLNSKAYNSTIINSYLAMFHSSRAFLYYEGYRERSHFCIARFLEEKYVKTKKLNKKWIELLDFYRELRHEDQYGLEVNTNYDEAKEAIESAKDFLDEMNKLYEIITKNN